MIAKLTALALAAAGGVPPTAAGARATTAGALTAAAAARATTARATVVGPRATAARPQPQVESGRISNDRPIGQEQAPSHRPGDEPTACSSLEDGFPTSDAWPYWQDVQGPAKLAPSQAFVVRAPRTWAEAVERARIVARARITGRAYEVGVDPYRGGEYVVSRYTAEVLEYIKPAPPASPGVPTLEIQRHGGVMVRDDMTLIRYDRVFADYLPGCEYIVFLDWDVTLDGYYPLALSDLTFLLDTNEQRVVSSSRLLRDGGEAETPLTLVELLRTLARR